MDLKGHRILVIGGAGLIGSHLVDQLLNSEAEEIVIYDNFSRGSMDNLREALKDPRVSVFADGGDILQVDVLEKAMMGIDCVFHLAALWILQCHQYPQTAFETNVRGTFNVVMAAIRQKVKRVVYSSSASVYGDAVTTPMTEDHPYNNFTFYGASKIAGEHFFKSLGTQHGLSWVAMRYMNVYGPRQDYMGVYTAVAHKILDRIEAGKCPEVHGDGSQTYDFVHVTDVARCNVLAMQADVSGECYNVGRGIGTSVDDLCKLLLRLTGADIEIEYVPTDFPFVTNRIGCPIKAEAHLGYKWTVDLEDGMKGLIEWRRTDQQVRAVTGKGSD